MGDISPTKTCSDQVFFFTRRDFCAPQQYATLYSFCIKTNCSDGSSPRGAQALVECGRVRALMHGRYHLSIDDIQANAAAVLRHRIILNFDAHADGQTPDTILSAISKGVARKASAA